MDEKKVNKKNSQERQLFDGHPTQELLKFNEN